MRSILYVDPPAFCTTVEELAAPALRSRPIVVAPPGADRALVLALSPEARWAGITRGMPLARARKLCPRDLVILPPNPRLYARASSALHTVLRRYAPLIEPRGYGHAFLDITGTQGLFGPPMDVASRIAREARTEVRLALSVGVATNKIVSQTATRTDRRADGRTGSEPVEVPVGTEAPFLSPLSVELFPDIPDPVRVRLEDYQLDFIGEIAGLDVGQACTVFGRSGGELIWRARGVDPRPVLPPALRAEFRLEHTLATDTNELDVLHPLLRRMTEALGRRLRQRGLVARRITVEVVYSDFHRGARGLPLRPASLDVEIFEAARRGLALACLRTVAVRTVAVMVDRLMEAELQLELFEEGRKDGRTEGRKDVVPSLQLAVDRIRTRWGIRAVGPASVPAAGSGTAHHRVRRVAQSFAESSADNAESTGEHVFPDKNIKK